MLASRIISAESYESAETSFKLDFQNGTVIIKIIPVDDSASTQEDKSFKADVLWSDNDKFYVKEPICNLVDDSSSGEALVTAVQAVYLKVVVKNLEPTLPQKYYISVYIPSTASSGV